MVDAEAQTESNLPATVVGVEKDLLIGVRVRKSFGARAFWGSVVGCYWVSGGLFYKVSFDDGDVDILSADEVMQDAQAAKKCAKENPQQQQEKETPTSTANETALDDYFAAMRRHHLKRKRDDVVDSSIRSVTRVNLWGQRLYASIYTNERNETYIKELLKTDDGRTGEMEATGQVQVGDMILAVNKTRVLGMPSRDLAELIKKPARPITLTFYRPQRSQAPTHLQQQQQQQRQEQSEQVQAPAASTAQQPPQSAPQSQPASTATQQQQTSAPLAAPVVVPPSFVVQQPAFARPVAVAHGLAQQWAQSASTSQQHGVLTKEIIRQRVAAARQAGYVPGYPMSTYMSISRNGPLSSGVQSVQNSAYQALQQHYLQRIGMAPGQPARPMHQPQTSAPAARFDHNPQGYQRQRTSLSLYEQQTQTRHSVISGVSRHPSEHTRPSPSITANATSESRFSSIPQDEPDRGTGSAQLERAQQTVLTSCRQPSNQESTNVSSSADNTTYDITRERTSTNALVSSAAISGTNILTTRDVESIARRDERGLTATARALRGVAPTTSMMSPNENLAEQDSHTTSFLSPSGPSAEHEDPTPIKREAEAVSHSMSFLSPNDFDSNTPSRRELSPGNTANKSADIRSNVSLVTVQVSRRRLYLTLGVQGTLIAVTSFVRDEFGRPGEVELSGKVFLGDVLVRINESYIAAGMTPTHVADIVNTASRPMTLLFERASWDVLDGKA